VIFKKGKLLRQVPERDIVREFLKEVFKLAGENRHGNK
jgi:hypothetical protein